MTEPGPKKKVSLPVVGQKPRSDGDDQGFGQGFGPPTAKSPAAWVVLGALSMFAVLVPLAMLSMTFLRGYYERTSTVSPGPTIAVAVAAVALAAFAGGTIVGRFGHRCGPREGALSGVLAGLVMWGMSRTGMGVAILLVTVPAAWVGAVRGRRARKPGDTIGA